MSYDALDRIDRKILRELTADGRISNADLAQKVGLSPSPCWQRVRRLQEQGFIRGYAAILDQEQLGASEIVMIDVILDRHDDEVVEDFGKTMQSMPEVLEVHLTTGEFDYLLRVVVPDLVAYERFLMDHLTRIKGIASIKSSFSLKQVSYKTALPLPS